MQPALACFKQLSARNQGCPSETPELDTLAMSCQWAGTYVREMCLISSILESDLLASCDWSVKTAINGCEIERAGAIQTVKEVCASKLETTLMVE